MEFLKDFLVSVIVITILILFSPFILVHKILMDEDEDKPNEQ